jgi:hypothetical protein
VTSWGGKSIIIASFLTVLHEKSQDLDPKPIEEKSHGIQYKFSKESWKDKDALWTFSHVGSSGSYTVFWAQVELDKSTWQVALVKLTCHPRFRPLFKSIDKWQLVKSSGQVSLKGDPL